MNILLSVNQTKFLPELSLVDHLDPSLLNRKPLIGRELVKWISVRQFIGAQHDQIQLGVRQLARDSAGPLDDTFRLLARYSTETADKRDTTAEQKFVRLDRHFH